jgi:hypothetical protein
MRLRDFRSARVAAAVGQAAFGTALLLAAADATPVLAAPLDPPRLAVFGFALINTSLQPTAPAENQRIRALDNRLRERLNRSGRFELVAIPADIEREIAAAPRIGSCNGCERDLARRVGADWAVWGTVQKVSNLILNINLYAEDAASGRFEFARSVDIRGNTYESWQRGLDYLLHHYFLRSTAETR